MSRRSIAGLVVASLLAGCPAPLDAQKRASPVGRATPRPTVQAGATPSGATPGPDAPAKGLRGLVLGQDGLPAAGVQVTAWLISDHGGGIISNHGAGVVSNGGAGVASNGGAALIRLRRFPSVIGKTKYQLRQVAATGKTAPDGRFAIALPDGTAVNVEAVLRDDVKAFVANAVAGNDVQMRLEKTGMITGRVRPPAGSGVTDLTGTDVFVPGSSYVAKTDHEGRFTITGVPVGTFELVVQRDHLGRALAHGIVVEPERTAQVPDLLLEALVPTIRRLEPDVVAPGSVVTLVGDNLGRATGSPVEVTIGGLRASVSFEADDRLRVEVPAAALDGEVVLRVNDVPAAPARLALVKALALAAWPAGPLRPGEVTYVSWRATGPNGEEVAEAPIVWSASGDAVKVDGGRVEAARAGTATVKAALGSLEATATLEVTDEVAVRTYVGYPEPAFAADRAAQDAAYATFRHRLLTRAAPSGDAKLEGPWQMALAGSELYVGHNAQNGTIRRWDLGAGVEAALPAVDAQVAKGSIFGSPALGPDGVLYAGAGGSVIGLFRLGQAGAELLNAGGIPAAFADGPPDTARMGLCAHPIFGPDGTLYFSDRPNHAVRRRRPDGHLETLVGGPGLPFADGPGATVAIESPEGLGLDRRGGLVVYDGAAYKLRRIALESADHAVTTVAGSGKPVLDDGQGLAAGLGYIHALATDAEGVAFAVDPFGQRVRRIDLTVPTYPVTTLAGTTTGEADGPASRAQLRNPVGVAVDGKRRYLFVSQHEANSVRIVRY